MQERGVDWLYLSGLAPSEPNNPWPITLKASHLPFSLFLGRGHRIFSLLVFSPSVRMPPPSFAVMNDHWPSHWQSGSWCHIITVSPFRQNYQITSVLKRPGRLTGRPTKVTQISKKEEDFEDSLNFNRQAGIFFSFFPGLERPITAKIFQKSRASLTFTNIDAKHLVSPSSSVFPFSQVFLSSIYPKIFDNLSLTGEGRGWANTSTIKTVPEGPRWTPDRHRECVLSDEVTFTMWVLTVSSGADVDLALRLAGTAVATMVELKCANFSSGNKGFHSVRTWNTKHGKTRRGKRHTEPIWAGTWR